MSSFDIKVLGGLPVTVEYTVVGIGRKCAKLGSVDDWRITHIGERRCKKNPEWLWRRLHAKRGEVDKLVAAAWDDFKLAEEEYWQ